ncbi:MAG: hypothetical protein J7493_03600 [Porphyrobacter sp.]|nr:hypothetical protein [Porphyrobacter sp.]
MNLGWLNAGVTGALALSLLADPVTAKNLPVVLEPASRWQIDYADEGCALRRPFESDGTRATLEILQQAPGAYFRVTVTSGTLGLSGQSAKVRFEPDDSFQVPSFLLSGSVGDEVAIAFTDSLQENVGGQPNVYIDWTDEERDRREGNVVALSTRDAFDRDVSLSTGPMHQPMQALRSCMKDLYATWGVDLDAHRTLSHPATLRNGSRIAERIRYRLMENSTRTSTGVPPVLRVIVGLDGRVTRCRIHFATWDAALSEEICGTVTRESRYDPAKDKAGNPIVSYDTILFSIS